MVRKSQSLWNRAGSFDSIKERQQSLVHRVSIPLEQGRVFRQHSFTFIYNCKFVSIPLEQGRVFRQEREYRIALAERSQSLWNRAGSFDIEKETIARMISVSIPLEQGRVFRLQHTRRNHEKLLSQSLWNRAGSFDTLNAEEEPEHQLSQSLWNRAGSFDILPFLILAIARCLNPFGTGQGLSTRFSIFRFYHRRSQSLWNRAGSFDDLQGFKVFDSGYVSIPLEQGRVFRLTAQQGFDTAKSQSLWNRAGSFDIHFLIYLIAKKVSIPLEQGRVFRPI